MFINDIFKKKLNEGIYVPEIPRAPQPRPQPPKEKDVEEDAFDDTHSYDSYVSAKSTVTSPNGNDKLDDRTASIDTDRQGRQRVRAIDNDEVTIDRTLPKGAQAKIVPQYNKQQGLDEAHGPYGQKKPSDIEKIQKAKEREKKNAPGQLRRELPPSKQRYRDSSIEYFAKLGEKQLAEQNPYMDTKPSSVTAKQADEFGAAAERAFKPKYYEPDTEAAPKRRNWDYSDPDIQPIVKDYLNKNVMDKKPMTYKQEVDEGSAQDRLHRRHQELRKKSGLPDPDYYKELKASYDIEDDAKRIAAQAMIKKKYRVAEAVNIGQEWISDTELDQYVPDHLQQQWRELFGYDEDGNPSALWANLTGGYEPDVQDPQHRALMVKVANKWFAAKKIPNVKFFDVKDAVDELEWLVQIGEQDVAETALNPKDPQGDYDAKRKVIHDLSLDPNVDQKAVQQRRLDLDREAKSKGLKEQGVAEGVERYLEEMRRAGYDIVTEAATLCPECGGPAYEDKMLAEKQDACYHKVKSRYKVWPSAYASGALVRCRKVGAKNWGNKSKK